MSKRELSKSEQRSLNEIPAYRTPTGKDKRGYAIMHNKQRMEARYQELVQKMYQLHPEKAKVLDATMRGEYLEEDFVQISRAIGFLLYHYRGAVDGVMPFDRTYVIDCLYNNASQYFPRAMQLLAAEGMRNAVTVRHQQRDPLEHTCDAMANMVELHIAQPSLDLETISLELMAILLHDFGKLHNPQDASHASGSVVWAKQWITKLAAKLPGNMVFADTTRTSSRYTSRYTKEQAGFLLNFLIQFHDIGGFIDSGQLTLEQGFDLMLEGDFIPDTQALLSLMRIQDADMRAIPGMPDQFVSGNRQVVWRLLQKLTMYRETQGIGEALEPTKEVRAETVEKDGDFNFSEWFFAPITFPSG